MVRDGERERPKSGLERKRKSGGKECVRESVLSLMRSRVLKPKYIAFGEIFRKCSVLNLES